MVRAGGGEVAGGYGVGGGVCESGVVLYCYADASIRPGKLAGVACRVRKRARRKCLSVSGAYRFLVASETALVEQVSASWM